MEELDLEEDDEGNESDSSDSSWSTTSTSSFDADMEYLECGIHKARTSGIPKDLNFADEILPHLQPDRFQQSFRMCRTSFLYIH
ncbi:hypothetical protein L211DRAFT_838589 [Terfezia boudieri ATCC MYA-4762]|uniref:Uncharacterized protein n=1 Tax=Terfezia boudieri ATCC MYA-4762 TaxID=1051890 RepID=A0A3N4LZE6_9PEZI|nr:hypothetical protein L211DRAFT_838589 [Terfezia boudieri ATCC MYA-4762]